MFTYLFSWPDQLPSLSISLSQLDRAAILIRQRSFVDAEALLLSLLPSANIKNHIPYSHFDIYVLIFWLYHSQRFYDKCSCLLIKLEKLISSVDESIVFLFVSITYWLDSCDSKSLNSLSLSSWNLEVSSPPFLLLYVEYLVRADQLLDAQQHLDRLTSPWSESLEAISLKASIYQKSFEHTKCLDLLRIAAIRFPQHLHLQSLLLTSTVEARSHKYTLPCLYSALSLHGEKPEFFFHLCRVALLRNRSADSRRFAIKDCLNKLTNSISRDYALTNYWVSQDRLGYSDWLNFIFPSNDSFSYYPLEVLEALVPQFASINSPSLLSESLLSTLLPLYKDSLKCQSISTLDRNQFASSSSTLNRPLVVAWISSDLCHHPVSRFLYGFFASFPELSHSHILVDTNDHGIESHRHHFENLGNIQVVNYGSGSLKGKVDRIRSLNADIAIDLNGWTANNFIRGFLARLSPIQINYLGYYASTGIPSMDYWLGDNFLFPESNSEWHTESLICLDRCFLVWNPCDPLPEASVDVVDSSRSSDIRFGSFNNIRKLSDETLSLWGQILSKVKGSSLVLKASFSDDHSTHELLRRRMIRQGLDVSRVVWLPRSDTSIKHLHQYAEIDIALDCFPNGGCTTTCEALWMGVPVITLTGESYVSRMSTAVLHGAMLPQYCVNSKSDYLKIAVELSSSRSFLRSNRDYWREKLLSSPLGNVTDFMSRLESSFSQLLVNSI